MTIRLIPAAPLTPGQSYTVTVDNSFHAMDGSALAEPYRFTFRAQGPTLIEGYPVDSARHPTQITPNQQFELAYSGAVDLPKLANAAYLELAATCPGQRIVRLRAVEERSIATDDPPIIRQAGGYQRDRSLDSLRRVVRLTPETALPPDCSGELVAPAEMEDQRIGTVQRWSFTTHGDLKIVAFDCGQRVAFCATGPVTVVFSTPVSGTEVLRRVHLLPDTKFTVSDSTIESMTWTLNAPLQLHTAYALVADTAMRDVFGQPLQGNPAAGCRTTGYAPRSTIPTGICSSSAPASAR